MSSFITETIEELPGVLLIVPVGQFAEEAAVFLRSKKLQVQQVTPSQLVGESGGVLQQQLLAQAWYKVIWFLEDVFSPDLETENVLGFLQFYGGALTIVAPTITEVETDQNQLEVWKDFSDRQREMLNRIQLLFPQASWILGENVLKSDRDVFVLSLLFSAAQRSLLDPQLELSFSNQDRFVQKATEFLMAPVQKFVLITSKPAITTEILNGCYAKLKQNQEEVGVEKVSSVLTRETLPGFRFETKMVASVSSRELSLRLAELVGGLIHTLPVEQSFSQGVLPEVAPSYFQAPSFSPQPPQMPPPYVPVPEKHSLGEELMALERKIEREIVVPIFRPLIENRLKKYEKRMEKTVKRKQSASFLPPQRGWESHTSQTSLNGKRQSGWEKKIDQEIQQIFGLERAQQKVGRVVTQVEKTIKHQKKKKRQSLAVVLGVVALTVFVFCSSLAIVFFYTQRELLSKLIALGAAQNQISANEQRVRAKETASLAQLFSFQVDSASFLLGKETLSSSAKLVALSNEMSAAILLSQDATQLSYQAVDQFFGRNSTNVFSTTLSLSEKTQQLYQKLSLIQTQITRFNQAEYGDAHVKELDNLQAIVQDKRKTLASVQQFQQLLSTLLAEKGRKTFLVILQNNQELRPTGGLIQTVALITIEKGVLIDYQVLDTSSIDNALKGSVKPPQEMQLFLGQTQWYLRDANWNPNFPASAQQMEWFAEKSLGKKVDGVIALNLLTLQQMIRSVGPITLPEYNEVVTDKNVLEKIEFHSEIKLVQTAQGDFLTVLFGKVLSGVAVAPSEKVLLVMNDVYEGFRSGQAFLYLNDPGEASLVSSLGWSGEVASPKCPVQFGEIPCVVDTLMQVESNVGINKANYYLERSIQDRINVSASLIQHERSVAFKNTATSNGWPLGSYKSYVRFYVPSQANLASIEVDGALLPPNSILIGNDGGKRYFGILIEVPIQKTVNVRLKYNLVAKQATPFAYTFFDQKQAGTKDDPLQITITPDASLHPVFIAPQATLNGDTATFTGVRDKHTFVGVKFN
jgi:hypothetical protein